MGMPQVMLFDISASWGSSCPPRVQDRCQQVMLMPPGSQDIAMGPHGNLSGSCSLWDLLSTESFGDWSGRAKSTERCLCRLIHPGVPAEHLTSVVPWV